MPVDELLVAARGRPDLAGTRRRRSSTGPRRFGERFGPLWATYWFRGRATVPEVVARACASTCSGVSASEATLWLDGARAAGAQHRRRAASAPTPCSPRRPSRRATRAADRARVQRDVRPAGAPVELHALRARALRPRRVAALPRLRDAARARGRRDAARRAWPGELREELNRFCNEGDPAILARALRAPERARTRTSSPRSATRTSTPRGCGRSPRPTARRVRTFSDAAALHGRVPRVPLRLLAGAAVRVDQGAQPGALGAAARGRRARASSCRSAAAGSSPTATSPSGESLVRQFLHGQRFFERELGRRCREFWSPDAFGYNGQLPQLMREVGHHALPDAEALVEPLQQAGAPHVHVAGASTAARCSRHFPPADTYNERGDRAGAAARPRATTRITTTSRTSLLVFGHGDGGGGPDARHARDAAPRARPAGPAADALQRTSEEFFDALEAEPAASGRSSSASSTSSTTAASTRRRRARSAATAAASRRCTTPSSSPSPSAASTRARSSTGSGSCSCCSSSTTSSRARRSGSSTRRPSATSPRCEAGARGDLRRRWGETPRQHDRLRAARGRGGRTSARVVEAPPYGFGARRRGPTTRCRVDGLVLENAHLRAELAPDGTLVVAGRQGDRPRGARRARQPARALRRPARSPSTPGTSTRPTSRRGATAAPASVLRVVTATPLRAEVAFERGSARQPLTQVVRLDAGSRRLEFHTTVDWREEHTLLKVCFPLAVRAPNATYEMPFGYAERPTHYSTSCDRGALRGAGPPLRRPLRARLRRRPADRLASTATAASATSCGSACCARRRAPTPRPTWAGTSSRTRSCRTRAAGARRASSPRPRASTRRCAGRSPGRVPRLARVGRRPEPRARHDQARRGLRRARAPALRGARRARHGARSGSASRSPRRGSRTRSRTTATPLEVEDGDDRPRLPPAPGR